MSMKFLTTAAVALIVSAAAASAQSGPVSTACKDDLAKYCAGKSHQNREARSCLESNKDKVSAACKSALDSTGGGKGKGMGQGKS